jgi:hypothetical protein
MLFRTILSAVALFSAASAFAGDQQGFTNIGIDDLKQKCSDFLANPQMKAVDVKILCGEHSFYWAPDKSAAGVLKNTRDVTVGLQMKNYDVRDVSYPATIADTDVSCQTYVKHEHKVTGIEVDLTCDQLLQIDDLAAYCDPIVAQRVAADPSLVDDQITADVLNFCPNAVK